MHPLTIYDIAMREHERGTTDRLREHVLRQRRRERLVRAVPRRATRLAIALTSRERPAAA